MNKNLILLLITFKCIHVGYAQQAWTMPKGKFYSQVTYNIASYDGIVDAQNNIVPLNRTVVHNTVQCYLQYGITNKLLVTTVVPINFLKSDKKGNLPQPIGLLDGKLNGLSNLQLGLTYKFYEKKGLVLSGKINTILPTAKNDKLTGLKTGDDAFGVESNILIGLGRTKFFTSLGLGLALRTNNYSSQSLIDFQIGKNMGKSKKLLSIFHIEFRAGNKNGTYADGNTKYTATYLNDLKYLSLGAKFGYKITPKVRAWTDLRFAAFASEKIGARTVNPIPGLTFGISYSN